MASLPCPAPSTLPEINAEYLGELEQGGASLVVCDDEHAHLGVLPATAPSAPTPAQLIESRAVVRRERSVEAPAGVQPSSRR